MGYSFRLAARVLLHASSHRQDNTYHGVCYTIVEHWLEREIAQWVHPMKDRSDDPSHHERTLLPRSYISLPPLFGCCYSKILALENISFSGIWRESVQTDRLKEMGGVKGEMKRFTGRAKTSEHWGGGGGLTSWYEVLIPMNIFKNQFLFSLRFIMTIDTRLVKWNFCNICIKTFFYSDSLWAALYESTGIVRSCTADISGEWSTKIMS